MTDGWPEWHARIDRTQTELKDSDERQWRRIMEHDTEIKSLTLRHDAALRRIEALELEVARSRRVDKQAAFDHGYETAQLDLNTKLSAAQAEITELHKQPVVAVRATPSSGSPGYVMGVPILPNKHDPAHPDAPSAAAKTKETKHDR